MLFQILVASIYTLISQQLKRFQMEFLIKDITKTYA